MQAIDTVNLQSFPIGKSETDNIFMAIPKIMADLKAVGKDQKNPQQGWKFRSIDDVYNAVQPIMAKYGVFTVPIIESEERKSLSKGIQAIIRYRFKFCARDGSSIDAHAIGEAIDYGDKVSNKCASIAHKYALLQVFCIPTEESSDPDFELHEAKPMPRQQQPVRAVKKSPGEKYMETGEQKIKLAKVCRQIGITDVDDIRKISMVLLDRVVNFETLAERADELRAVLAS